MARHLTCLPLSICSWNFRVLGTPVDSATVEFDPFFENGSITLGTMIFQVRKHGPLSGQWTLEREGRVHADARKPNAFFRAFEVP